MSLTDNGLIDPTGTTGVVASSVDADPGTIGFTNILQKLIVTPDVNYDDPSDPLPADSYVLPENTGTSGQAMILQPDLHTLAWGNPVVDGGNDATAPFVIGTLPSSAQDLKLISSADIVFGSGVRYQFDAITTAVSPLSVTSAHYLISIQNGADTNFVVNLPAIEPGNEGRQYIISNDHVGTVTIVANVASSDTIDGQPSFTLALQGQRVRLTSTGTDSWFII